MNTQTLKTTAATATLGFAGLFANAANGAIITEDFETPDFVISTIVGTSYNTENYTFTSDSADMGIAESDAGSYVGSQTLLPFTSTAIVSVTEDSALPFDAISVDISELGGSSLIFPEVAFTGHIVGGGTVSQTFQTDGSFGLETFNFNSGFTNLTSLDFTGANGTTYQIDNLKVQTIPEPSSLALLGAAGLAAMTRRRRLG